MTPKDRIKAIQELLAVAADGQFGPKSRAALEALIMEAKGASPVPESGSAVRFRKFMPFIFSWEGEAFENDPDDPGGATKFGIDQRSHPEVNIRDLAKDQALAIYYKEWQEAGCDGMQTPYAQVFFNCAVNMGLGRAREFDAAAKGDAGVFLDLQEAKYRSIATRGTMGKFLKGWLNRTTDLRKRFGL